MKNTELLKRVDDLISQGRTSIINKFSIDNVSGERVRDNEHTGFRAASLSFILSLFDSSHPYYMLFVNKIQNQYVSNVEGAISILVAIRHEIVNGWLIKIKELVTAEIFTDFLEMSEHLLDEGYKDPAAVMIGSVLEEHLRVLCASHNVDTHISKGPDSIPKKADLLNAELKKAGAYGPLEQKSVTAWLDLRNSAAHGKYNEYRIEQVKLMFTGVLDFVTRVR